MSKKIAVASAALVAAAAAAPAMAQTATGPDYSALTGAIDFGSTQTAILSVGALAVTVTLAVMGVRKVIGLVRGA
ncbi:hypothetical protein NRB_06640 [Novosphingobium sp. 11B]